MIIALYRAYLKAESRRMSTVSLFLAEVQRDTLRDSFKHDLPSIDA